jgi:hypothetical protein
VARITLNFLLKFLNFDGLNLCSWVIIRQDGRSISAEITATGNQETFCGYMSQIHLVIGGIFSGGKDDV